MIRVAVLGAGHWGPNLIRSFHTHVGSEVLHVVDRDPARLAALRPHYPEVALHDDAGRAVDDPKVDAVVVATPSSTHHELAAAALERGKHVLVEKPMATSVQDAEHLGRLAEQGRRVLMVGHVFVYNAAVRWVKQAIARGDLGTLHYIAALRTNLGPIRTDVNAAWDLAAHDLSIVDYWLGASPRSVSAMGGTWVNARIEDTVFATLRYPSDVVVNLHVSWLNPMKVRHITVVGERRMLTCDDMQLSEPIRVYDKGVAPARAGGDVVDTFGAFRSSVRDGDIVIPRVPAGEPLRAECEHFLHCIASGSRPETGAPEGIAVVRALQAIDRSMRAAGREEVLS